MIRVTDGAKAKEFFGASKDGEILQEAIVAAIARGMTLATQLAALAVTTDMQDAVIDAMEAKVDDVRNTALDAAVDVLVERYGIKTNAPEAAAVAGAALLTAGASPGKAREALYRAGSMLGDAEAIASGDPEKIARRAGQHVFWRAFGQLGRNLFRKL